RSYPFAVCYMGITGVELCVDSSHSDNEAKYVRRSCTPNAKVVHILDKNGLRFFICATKTIPLGKEITIPFYFDYHRRSACMFI
ncbi:hypothetical protein HELRODRAFT_70550, partial [Helobdella robusta]|uniref:SET domain-containing protein n=1 Tax=Helobdella robusta TaxID=6412 RepID=T1G081_HELRO